MVPALLHEISWTASRNCSSDLSQVLDVSALLGDKVTAPCKDKRLFRLKCHSILLELWASNPRKFPATQGQGCCDMSGTPAMPYAPPSPWRWTRPPLTKQGSCRKTGSMELQQSPVLHRHQPALQILPAPTAEPPRIRSMVKQGKELCQAAGQGHAAEVGEGSQFRKETVNYTNALQFKKGCPTGCKTIIALLDLLQNQMLQLKGPLWPALFSSEL